MNVTYVVIGVVLLILAIITTLMDGIKTTLLYAGIGVGAFLICKLSVGYLSMIAGLGFAGILTWKWIQNADETGSASTSGGTVSRNFRPLSFILRIYLAVILYFALCKYDLLPASLVHVPTYITEIFF